MRKKIILAIFFVLVVSLAMVVVVAAQIGDGFDLSWSVLSGGGGASQSSSGYALTSTVGQTAVLSSSGSGAEMSHGFWQDFLAPILNRLPFTVKH